MQYLLDQPDVDWTYLDHRGEPDKIQALLADDRKKAFDIHGAALTRFHLLRTGDDTYKLIWTFHPILMDGWCISLIIRQLFEAYDSLLDGTSPRPHAGPVYKDYLNWLARARVAQEDGFWSTYLASVEPVRFEMSGMPSRDAEDVVPTLAFHLGEALSRDLARFCADHGLTPATVFQAVWGEILSAATGNDAPVFGLAISGRNIDLDRAGEVIGLMTSVVPCKVARTAPWSMKSLWELQKQNAALQDKGHTTLRDINLAAGLDPATPLFNTVLVIENFEFLGNLPKTDRYSITNIEWVERSEFDLVIGVVPGADHLIELNYAPEVFDRSQMRKLQHQILEVIRNILSLDSNRNGNLGKTYFFSEVEQLRR